MFTRKPRLQLEKFAINGAKRLLQHNLPIADMVSCEAPAGIGGARLGWDLQGVEHTTVNVEY